MLISLLQSNPVVFFVVAGALVIALTIHEFAHAWLADRLGDPTPRYQDRVTLNPLAHLDPIGTIALLFLGFGWGKPVQFDPYNLKDPIKDSALIALAGPASNFALAIVFSMILNLTGTGSILAAICALIIQFNIYLGVFNLLPIAPLDGSKVIMALLPKKTGYDYELFMNKYGTIILLGLIFLPLGGPSLISRIIFPISQLIINILV